MGLFYSVTESGYRSRTLSIHPRPLSALCLMPVLADTGNEGPITAFYGACGFMTEVLAPKLGGLLLFAEQRFSQPPCLKQLIIASTPKHILLGIPAACDATLSQHFCMPIADQNGIAHAPPQSQPFIFQATASEEAKKYATTLGSDLSQPTAIQLAWKERAVTTPPHDFCVQYCSEAAPGAIN